MTFFSFYIDRQRVDYEHRIAYKSLHFSTIPEQFDDEEINKYLISLALNPRSPSRSQFLGVIEIKHIECGIISTLIVSLLVLTGLVYW